MIRKFFAIICGLLAGLLLSAAIDVGLRHRFPDELESLACGALMWGEHWFLRAVATILCTFWAGFMAGLIGREKGNFLAIIAVLPAWVLWILVEYTALTGYFPFFDAGEIYVSIGNKISIGFVILAMLPVAWVSGANGEMVGKDYSTHFDSRKHTLLGIGWYHYIWIPFVLHLIIMQGSFAGLYFLTWVKAVWKTSFSIFGSIVPTIFTLMVYGTLYLMGIGVIKTYLILAGFEEINSRRNVAVKVLQYAIGFQVIAMALQYGIEYVHYTITKWLS